jgi:hypothetical protein
MAEQTWPWICLDIAIDHRLLPLLQPLRTTNSDYSFAGCKREQIQCHCVSMLLIQKRKQDVHGFLIGSTRVAGAPVDLGFL